jgi:hypothetical protein
VTDDAATQKKALPRRAAALSLGVTLGSLAVPALAVPDSPSWEDAGNPSLVGALIVIGGPVVAIIAVIALLTYLPSMMGRGSGSGDLSYNDPEWFGGPRAGVRTDAEQSTDTGGSGGRW